MTYFNILTLFQSECFLNLALSLCKGILFWYAWWSVHPKSFENTRTSKEEFVRYLIWAYITIGINRRFARKIDLKTQLRHLTLAKKHFKSGCWSMTEISFLYRNISFKCYGRQQLSSFLAANDLRCIWDERVLCKTPAWKAFWNWDNFHWKALVG